MGMNGNVWERKGNPEGEASLKKNNNIVGENRMVTEGMMGETELEETEGYW